MKKIIRMILLLILFFLLPTSVVWSQQVEKSGPAADELLYKFYFSPETEWLALVTGEINIMDAALPVSQIQEALVDL